MASTDVPGGTGNAPPAPSPARPRRRAAYRWLIVLASIPLGLLLVWLIVAYVVRPEYAYLPGEANALNELPVFPSPAYDVWGRAVSTPEAAQLARSEEGRALLAPENGAVPIDDGLLRLGKRAFYEETFGNEIFLTDVLGILDGPLNATQLARALADLGGAGTTNLRVPLAETVTVGGKTFEKGTLIDTGLDVPAGAYVPLGMRIKYVGGRVYAGITCAACHSTVDPVSKKVIHGAPNADLNAGLLLAMATNSAAYVAHTDIASLDPYVKDASRTVPTTGGGTATLPDPQALEDAVDAVLLKWPPGSFDSMIDLQADPAQIPSSFTRGSHPFNWSGGFMAGPFRGLSVQTNNVHGLNADPLNQADAAPDLFGMDKERYLGTLLQNAASRRYRYDPARHGKPSEFFASVDPTPGVPGIVRGVVLPTYPKASLIAPNSLWSSNPGEAVWKRVNAMAAWQDTLIPPRPPLEAAPAASATRGRAVFEKAGCAKCHAGKFGTNNRVIAVAEIGTEPVRARALKKTGESLAPEAIAYAFDVPVPLPDHPRTVTVPAAGIDRKQLELAYALGGSGGGYKVPGLAGLYWSAPYLHDGGVAVGADAESHLGMAGTLMKGIAPDPANSLRALLDHELRKRVVAANHASAELRAMNVQGIGHEFWVDAAAGFARADQDALVHYLLTFEPGKEQAR